MLDDAHQTNEGKATTCKSQDTQGVETVFPQHNSGTKKATVTVAKQDKAGS